MSSGTLRNPVSQHSYNRAKICIEYDGTEAVVAIDDVLQEWSTTKLAGYVAHHYMRFLLDGLFPDPFILSAERFGISLFYRELDFTKNQLVDLLQKIGDAQEAGHSLPISVHRGGHQPLRPPDQGQYRLYEEHSGPAGSKEQAPRAQTVQRYQGHDGRILRLVRQRHTFHLEDTWQRTQLQHTPASRFLFRTRVFRTSTSIYGMWPRRNHLLIIDEPESHLDTANQIQLTRLLARLVRAGSKVLITTHSDYLIMEINNLLMLDQPFSKKKALVKKLGYSTDDFLRRDSIRAYVAEHNGLTKCDVNEFGIDMPVFDETMDKINQVANELASRVMTGQGE